MTQKPVWGGGNGKQREEATASLKGGRETKIKEKGEELKKKKGHSRDQTQSI